MNDRDYFAAAAMQGRLSSWPATEPHPADFNLNVMLIAQQSYVMADAMLEARRKYDQGAWVLSDVCRPTQTQGETNGLRS